LLLSEMSKRTPVLVRPLARMIAAAVQKNYSGPTIAAQLDFIESELTASPWFTGGSFSAADVMMSFPLEAASDRIGLGKRTHMRDWLARIHDRPGYKAALQKGGPYAYVAVDG
jgi:glutathione S-transferase